MYIYAKYSKIDPDHKEFIHKRLLKFIVPKLRFVYPGFKRWLQTKVFNDYFLMPNREVIICTCSAEIVGVAILKKVYSERKICCLYVDKRFRYSCIGSELLHKSFEYLETTKPLITVQYKEYKQFACLFKNNKFELTNVNKVTFKPFFKELEFNGNCLFNDYPLKKTVHIDEKRGTEIPYIFVNQQNQNATNTDNKNCWEWLSKNPVRDLYWFRSPEPALGYYGYGPLHYQRCGQFDPFAPYNYYMNGGICKMERKTLVISAFPACGKTFYTKSVGGTGKIVLDSDSSEYSWINSTREATSKEYEEHRCMYVNDEGDVPIYMDEKRIRNPEFPQNYIKHIKENIGKADIIFVSSHIAVRQALTDAEIDYITIYPTKKCKAEWIGRMYLRGNDKAFIDMQVEHWDEWIDAVEKEPHGKFVVYLNPWHFINDYVLDKIMGVMRNEQNLASVDKIVFGEFKEPHICN